MIRSSRIALAFISLLFAILQVVPAAVATVAFADDADGYWTSTEITAFAHQNLWPLALETDDGLLVIWTDGREWDRYGTEDSEIFAAYSSDLGANFADELNVTSNEVPDVLLAATVQAGHAIIAVCENYSFVKLYRYSAGAWSSQPTNLNCSGDSTRARLFASSDTSLVFALDASRWSLESGSSSWTKLDSPGLGIYWGSATCSFTLDQFVNESNNSSQPTIAHRGNVGVASWIKRTGESSWALRVSTSVDGCSSWTSPTTVAAETLPINSWVYYQSAIYNSAATIDTYGRLIVAGHFFDKVLSAINYGGAWHALPATTGYDSASINHLVAVSPQSNAEPRLILVVPKSSPYSVIFGTPTSQKIAVKVLHNPLPPKNPVKAVSTVKPSVSGTAKATKTLTANKGTWTGYPTPKVSYQWYACGGSISTPRSAVPTSCKKIPGATKSTFKIARAQKGKFISVLVTGVSSGTSKTTWLSKSTSKVS